MIRKTAKNRPQRGLLARVRAAGVVALLAFAGLPADATTAHADANASRRATEAVVQSVLQSIRDDVRRRINQQNREVRTYQREQQRYYTPQRERWPDQHSAFH